MYVIFWKYSDGSGCGVVKVYASQDTASKDLEMLREHGDGMKVFEIVKAAYNDAERQR